MGIFLTPQLQKYTECVPWCYKAGRDCEPHGNDLPPNEKGERVPKAPTKLPPLPSKAKGLATALTTSHHLILSHLRFFWSEIFLPSSSLIISSQEKSLFQNFPIWNQEPGDFWVPQTEEMEVALPSEYRLNIHHCLLVKGDFSEKLFSSFIL